MLRFFGSVNSSVADTALVYQRNIYHGVEQVIFMQGDKGMLSLRQTSTDLYPEKTMVYVTSRGPG